ncbi:MAG: hypothetical protein EA428_02315 [Spirochaetaceae bacterium]|nr:MAG: hypothetical protein EA428_02315 [Spirochaetaceae bacterium]
MLCAAYTLAQVSLPLQTLTAQVAGEAGSNRVLDGQVQATNAYVEVTAERLRRASLAEADRILRDPALQHAPSVEALVLAVFARHKREELEYLLIRVMDLFVLDRNGVPRAELLEPNAYVFERLAERYYSFVDPSLRYRVLLLTAERDSHAARKMVQHGFARVLTRLNEGGTSLTPAELQEALVMCQVAARFPHPATALGAALVAEKARIPELVQAARNAARVTRTPAGEVNE